MPDETCAPIGTTEHQRIVFQAPSEDLQGNEDEGTGDETEASVLSIDCLDRPQMFGSQDTIAALCKRGLRRVIIRPTLFEPTADRNCASWLIALRDLASCAVEIEWHCSPRCTIPASALRHLPSPVEGSKYGNARYGSLYWRRGPGFVGIRDTRDNGVRLFVLDDDDSRETFLRSVDAVCCDDVTVRARQELQQEELVVEVGGWLVALPYRMRHWPVPFRAI